MAPALRTLLWPLAGIFMLTTFSASGQDQDIESLSKEQLRKLHGKFDTDSNGKVSLQEVMGFAQKMSETVGSKDLVSVLKEMDTNKDGKLSLQEHLNHVVNRGDAEQKKLETNKFKAADTNDDGYLSAEEIPAIHPGALEVTVREGMRWKDRNGDGLLTAKEFWEYKDSNHQVSEKEMKDFGELDKDASGSLNHDELQAWETGIFHTEATMTQLLAICDNDRDKQCSIEELEKAREQVAGSDPQHHHHDVFLFWAERNDL